MSCGCISAVPRPLGFNALMPIPVAMILLLGRGRTPAPAWSWPRSRRSGCLPAEPYLPPRSFVVYSHGEVHATVERKKSLTFAALSDMSHYPNSALIDKAQLAFANRHRNPRLAYSPFLRHSEQKGRRVDLGWTLTCKHKAKNSSVERSGDLRRVAWLQPFGKDQSPLVWFLFLSDFRRRHAENGLPLDM